HVRGIGARFDDRGYECRELRRRPALLGRELGMDEVHAVQRVVLVLDASIHVHAATRARVTLDGGAWVHDFQLVRVCSHTELVARRYRNLREQRAGGLPALRAAANVIVGGLGLDRYGNFPVGTFAVQRAACEIWSRRLDATIDRRMDGNCIGHDCTSSCNEPTAEPSALSSSTVMGPSS